MRILLGLLWPLERVNTTVLAIGRVIATLLLVAMVCMILGQVFWRTVLNNAHNWTEEGARFGMLWMTGLMAPIAFRRGGFVAIDSLERALPLPASRILSLVLLLICAVVLWVMIDKGLNNHVGGLLGRGKSATLYLPFDWFGGERIRFHNAWAFSSLLVGCVLMLSVCVELVLRQTVTIMGGADRLSTLPDAEVVD